MLDRKLARLGAVEGRGLDPGRKEGEGDAGANVGLRMPSRWAISVKAVPSCRASIQRWALVSMRTRVGSLAGTWAPAMILASMPRRRIAKGAVRFAASGPIVSGMMPIVAARAIGSRVILMTLATAGSKACAGRCQPWWRWLAIAVGASLMRGVQRVETLL